MTKFHIFVRELSKKNIMNRESKCLKKIVEFQHNLTVWYLSLLKDTDVDKCFECEGVKINSLYWITAHLANSEDALLQKALGKEGHQYEWLKKYSLGSNQDIKNEVPYHELVKIAKEIHISCMQNLDEMTDAHLNKDNSLGITFMGDSSIRTIIMHHIRHQGVHTGQLSLLCKLNGIKTV